MSKRKTLIIGLSFAIFVVFAMVGLTYAFFTASVGGNDRASSTIVETAELKLVFNGTEIIQMEEALPGQSVTKTFTVENKGNIEIEYTIDITDVINEFQSGDLVYTLTSTNAGATANKEVLPTSDKTLKTATIAPGVVQTYTLEILFRETGSNQNSSQGASFSGKLQINAIGEYSLALVRVAGTVVDNSNNPIANATVELHSEVKSAVTDENGRFSISGVMPGRHTLIVKDSNNVQKTSKMVEIEDNVTGVNIKLKNDGTSEITGVTTRTTLTEKMLEEVAQSDENLTFRTSTTYDRTIGLYYTSNLTRTEDMNADGIGEVVYYYRGAVENNYLVFGNYCWRIVRTVEDGSVKIIYYGSATPSGESYTCPQTASSLRIGSSLYFASSADKSNVNYKTSDIKTVVENWYRDNIYKNGQNTKVTNLIADTPYCNDMSEPTTNYFGAYNRIYTNKSPQYKCPSSTYAYTVAKGDLTYPVGLITADEVSYGGGATGREDNSGYYLYYDQNYWTMSPASFNGTTAYVWNIDELGIISTRALGTYSAVVIPVISLKAEATVKRGTGAYNDPFVINTD